MIIIRLQVDFLPFAGSFYFGYFAEYIPKKAGAIVLSNVFTRTSQIQVKSMIILNLFFSSGQNKVNNQNRLNCSR